MEQRNSTLIAAYYDEHHKELTDYATRMLHGDVMTAEDAIHDTFLRLLVSHSPIMANTLHALVYTTLRNRLSDIWRHRQHQLAYHRQSLATATGQPIADDVLACCSARQLDSLLERKMAHMKPDLAKVLRMNICDDKPVSEISRELATNYKTIENRLLKARHEMRQYMRRLMA